MREHPVGSVIRHLLTGEEGRIVRTVHIGDAGENDASDRSAQSALIVSVPAGPLTPAREVLWHCSEVEVNAAPALVEECAVAVASGPPADCWVCGREIPPDEGKLDDIGRHVHLACDRSDSIPIDTDPAS